MQLEYARIKEICLLLVFVLYKFYRDIRIRSFVDDLEREKNSALLIIQKIPHALPTKTVTIKIMLQISLNYIT